MFRTVKIHYHGYEHEVNEKKCVFFSLYFLMVIHGNKHTVYTIQITADRINIQLSKMLNGYPNAISLSLAFNEHLFLCFISLVLHKKRFFHCIFSTHLFTAFTHIYILSLCQTLWNVLLKC